MIFKDNKEKRSCVSTTAKIKFMRQLNVTFVTLESIFGTCISHVKFSRVTFHGTMML